VEFERSEQELTRKATAGLVRDPVEVAISRGAGPLRWIPPHERDDVWRMEIEPNFHDQPGWKPPPSAPGQLPFHAEVWSRGEKRVVLITDRD
jgi:hypothetical protein